MKKLLILAIIFFATTNLWAQSVSITESAGWLESAYVKWAPVTGATSYNSNPSELPYIVFQIKSIF